MNSFDRYVKAKTNTSKLHIDTLELLKVALGYLEERGLALSEEERAKTIGKVPGSDCMTIGFLLLAYNGSKLTLLIEQQPDLFSEEVRQGIKNGKVLDFLFKGAHRLRNEADFKTFINDERVQILWRKFVKANKHEIFNSMEINAIRGKKNLLLTQQLLNDVNHQTGITFSLNFDAPA